MRWLGRARALARALVFAAAAAAAAAGASTVERELANGLRVIVKPDRRAPVAVVMVWYRVGSMDEVSGTTGAAHVLEHMMFKGTKARPAGEFSRLVAAAGGRENAFTARDYTAYFIMLQASQLELALELEADRMANLLLAEEDFAKEIKVVMEERRWRTEDRPRSLVFEQLAATAFVAHPYRNPVIGWMSDLAAMRVEDVRAFYERWYAPNNAIVVVVGDVEPERVFALAERHFGLIAARPLPVRKPQEEPPQRGMKRVTVKAPAELPYVVMAFRAPALRDPARDWEPYALEMLAAVLDGHEAARLNRTLVRTERLASAAGAAYDALARGPGLFYLSAAPVPGKSAAELEQALRREIRRIIEEGVTEEELARAKAQAVAAHVFERDSMMAQARQIGMLEAIGISHRTIDLQLERLRAVSAEQVRAVARKYFSDDALTVVALDPQPLAGRRPVAPPPGLRHAQ